MSNERGRYRSSSLLYEMVAEEMGAMLPFCQPFFNRKDRGFVSYLATCLDGGSDLRQMSLTALGPVTEGGEKEGKRERTG